VLEDKEPIKYSVRNNFQPKGLSFQEPNEEELGLVEEGETYIVDMNRNVVKKIGSDSEEENREVDYSSFFDRES
jgi:hypothetical protein